MIIPIMQVRHEFSRAHRELVDKLPSFKQSWMIRSKLKEDWFKIHRAIIHCSISNGTWESIEFLSEKDYILWLLKYS